MYTKYMIHPNCDLMLQLFARLNNPIYSYFPSKIVPKMSRLQYLPLVVANSFDTDMVEQNRLCMCHGAVGPVHMLLLVRVVVIVIDVVIVVGDNTNQLGSLLLFLLLLVLLQLLLLL